MKKDRKKIAIVGVGLIGGSLALRLHEMKISEILFGVETNSQHAQEALELELVDEIVTLDEAIEMADVIILAIPVNTMVETLPAILDKLKKGQIVLDLGSTKSSLIEVIKDHPNRGRFIATHPMWGTEYSGPKAAVSNSYSGKAVIVVDAEHSDEDVVAWTYNMYNKIGMRIVEMGGTSHDLHVAYISHISHITSFALANTVLEKEKEDKAIFALASAGFESTVRLAKSNADMWVPIFQQNSENIVEVLDEHIRQLQLFRDGIKNNDGDTIRTLITQADKIRRIIQ